MIDRRHLLALLGGAFIGGCQSPNRMGMVRDPETGLQWGSAVEHSILVDASQFANRKARLRLRNTSGDRQMDLARFQGQLERELARKGYEPVQTDDFGVLFDTNVVYSGEVTTSLVREFAFLGAAGGALVGSAADRGLRGGATGGLLGATLGAIAGSYATDNTYIVIAEFALGVPDVDRGQTSSALVFGDGQRRESTRRSNFRPLRDTARTRIAAYAGGRNVSQAQIAEGVRQRFADIVSNMV